MDAALRRGSRRNRRPSSRRFRIRALHAARGAGRPPWLRCRAERLRRSRSPGVRGGGAQSVMTARHALKPRKGADRVEAPVALAAVGLEAEFAVVLDGKAAKPERVFGSPTKI